MESEFQKEIESVDRIDAIIHERSRLKIMLILRRTAGADYLFIQRLTGLSKGNLSNHLAKLEEAGLVDVHKHFVGKKPVTTVKPTEKGRAMIEEYWKDMKRIEEETRWQPSESYAPGAGFGAAYGGATSA